MRKELIDKLVKDGVLLEMRLCEQGLVILKPDQLYIFTVDPACAKCVDMELRGRPQFTPFTPEEVSVIVGQLRAAEYNKVGQAYFDERIACLKSAGWVLGIYAYRRKVWKGAKGHALRHPRYEWRNAAYFYNTEARLKVFYWDNPAYSMSEAKDIARTCPAPSTFAFASYYQK